MNKKYNEDKLIKAFLEGKSLTFRLENDKEPTKIRRVIDDQDNHIIIVNDNYSDWVFSKCFQLIYSHPDWFFKIGNENTSYIAKRNIKTDNKAHPLVLTQKEEGIFQVYYFGDLYNNKYEALLSCFDDPKPNIKELPNGYIQIFKQTLDNDSLYYNKN